MIVSILLVIASTVIYIVGTLFGSLVTVAIPQGFIDTLNTAFASLNALSGFFNTSTFIEALIWYLTVFSTYYAVKGIIWLVGFIPGVGQRGLPTMSEHVLDLSARGGHNVLDLRRGIKQSKGRRSNLVN
jgi:hypothetical protein